MKFIKKAEKFFNQLRHTLSIDAIQTFSLNGSLELVDIDSIEIRKQIETYGLDFPYEPEIRIAELRHTMLKEGLEPESAVRICSSLKDRYWVDDWVMPISSEGIIKAHVKAIKAVNSCCSEQEAMKMYFEYNKYQFSKRNQIFDQLINELTKTSTTKPQTTPPTVEHNELKNNLSTEWQLFAQEGYGLFLYLVENYTRDNKTLKAKFSNLYHYLNYEGLILGTQLQYISFIETEYQIKLSKITPQTIKYKDKIQPLLTRFYSSYRAESKKE